MSAVVHLGDSRAVLAELPRCSVDAIVCDPPYELAFMGRKWDATGIAFDPAFWALVSAVLKPGGHLLAFGGTRTYHRMACAIEDAGFEVRDSLHWAYSQGFPKSLDVSKAIDAAQNVQRDIIGYGPVKTTVSLSMSNSGQNRIGARKAFDSGPATDAARTWSGWGTALKPAHEPIVMARRPLDGTVAGNVLRWGTGGINVEGCRVQTEEELRRAVAGGGGSAGIFEGKKTCNTFDLHPDGLTGRWPPNLLFSHHPTCTPSDCVEGCAVADMEAQSQSSRMFPVFEWSHESSESAIRYCPKPHRTEREAGCEGLPTRSGADAVDREEGSAGTRSPSAGAGRTAEEIANYHPTVKPIDMMRWLCRLVTPPGGTVLDPFAGSGTTGCGAVIEGFRFVGIEREAEYHRIAEARIGYWSRQGPNHRPATRQAADPSQGRLFG
jgi:DNA modification methylase